MYDREEVKKMVELTFKNEKTGLTQTLEFQGNAITGDGNYLYSV